MPCRLGLFGPMMRRIEFLVAFRRHPPCHGSTMATLRRALPLCALVALLGCGSDSTSPAGLTINDLVGSWIATSDLYTNNANSSETFDLVAEGGEVRFTMLAGGGTRIWITLDTYMDEFDAAVTLNGTTLTIDPVEAGRETTTFEITLVGNTLTMTDADSEFDFSLSDAPAVSATEVAVFVPNT